MYVTDYILLAILSIYKKINFSERSNERQASLSSFHSQFAKAKPTALIEVITKCRRLCFSKL